MTSQILKLFEIRPLHAQWLMFSLPILMIQGEQDLVTTPEGAKNYYNSVIAPKKPQVLLARTGHDPNEATIDAQYTILKTVNIKNKQ